VVQRAWLFMRCAGTLILAVSIITWAALYYPHNPASVRPLRQRQETLEARFEQLPAEAPERAVLEEELLELNRKIIGEQQRQSILGRLGRLIEPAVRPLGWDWRIGCAVLASLPAREVVVATMGVIYNLGEGVDAGSQSDMNRLQKRMRLAVWDDSGEPVFTIPVALSILVFYALCAQCAGTLAVMRQETGGWRWPAFMFVYMTVLAYVGALIVYHAGTWIAGIS
jgi:ferrous iron transport protein B